MDIQNSFFCRRSYLGKAKVRWCGWWFVTISSNFNREIIKSDFFGTSQHKPSHAKSHAKLRTSAANCVTSWSSQLLKERWYKVAKFVALSTSPLLACTIKRKCSSTKAFCANKSSMAFFCFSVSISSRASKDIDRRAMCKACRIWALFKVTPEWQSLVQRWLGNPLWPKWGIWWSMRLWVSYWINPYICHMRTKKSFGNWPAWTHTHFEHFQKIGDDTSGLKLRLPWFGPGKKTNQLIYSATNVHNKTTTPKIRIMWKVTARKPKVHSLINFCTGWLLAAWSFQKTSPHIISHPAFYLAVFLSWSSCII